MWLSVWQKNPRAIAFYQKWGFEIAGTATFTIGSDVQTDWIMGRGL
jgi:ribosomal protein S18 acetylase RimI-like enzyme